MVKVIWTYNLQKSSVRYRTAPLEVVWVFFLAEKLQHDRHLGFNLFFQLKDLLSNHYTTMLPQTAS